MHLNFKADASTLQQLNFIKNTSGSMDNSLSALVEYGEAAAYADLFRDAPSELNMETCLFGHATAISSPLLQGILFNRVLGLGINEPVTRDLLQEIKLYFAGRGIAKFAVQMAPDAVQPQVEEWLNELDFVKRDNWSKVYRHSASTPVIETSLRLVQIQEEYAPQFAEVAARAFNMPHTMQPWLLQHVGKKNWQHYMAFEGDMPVATAAMFIRNKIAWLGLGSTLPEHRRKGAQGALMARRIADAAKLGCEWVITETGEDLGDKPNPSYHNMLRTGFQLLYQRPNFICTIPQE